MKCVSSRSLVFAASAVLLTASASAQQVLFATSGPVNSQLFTVDPSTGSIQTSMPISNDQALFGGLARDGSDLYSIDGYNDGISDRTFRIDSATGNGTVVGDTGQNWNFRSVEIHPQTSVLYATRDNELYTLNKLTGAATSVAALSGATLDQFTCLAIDSTGTAYGLDIGGTGLFRVNLANGVLTHLGDLNMPFWAQDAAIDASNQMWAVLGNGGMYRIDVAAVTATYQFACGGWGGIAFGPGCAPPSTYCTVGTTALGCAPAITSTGTPSASATSGFTLSCSGVDANASGVFFYGVANPAFVPLQWGPGGTSYYCVKSPVERLDLMNSGGTSGCTGSFTKDWRAFMASEPGAIGNPLAAGMSFDAQLWMRDPPSPKSTILSNALRFTLCP